MSQPSQNQPSGQQPSQIQCQPHPQAAEVLTPQALAFVEQLQRRFGERQRELLAAREARQQQLDAGHFPDFLPGTAQVRAGDWTISPLPEPLQDRRVEITGPVDRKMVINALNSGAKMFMADFEDANSPTWANCVAGQVNLCDANRGDIRLETPQKTYQLGAEVATLLVRPRGLHLEEKHATLEGQSLSGSLFDFGLYAFHNAQERLGKGQGLYFYIPKLESHLEARWWNDVFTLTEDQLGLERGTIRATVLIETITAAFEMDEILYELRKHSAGLNCGRWDYIFSFIKKFRAHPDKVLPDRSEVTMAVPMMENYSKLAIQTCHKRGAPAIGGMSAFIPVKGDEAANDAAFARVRADKEREARNGHDGTWVAHPGMVALAREVFDELMPQPNQIASDKQRDVTITAADLLTPPAGDVTDAGVEMNVDVSIQYIAAWLDGRGAVPIHNLMEDAATAEISRAQLWQWRQHGISTKEGTAITAEHLSRLIDAHTERLSAEQPERRERLHEAAELLRALVNQPTFGEFLTLPGYQRLA